MSYDLQAFRAAKGSDGIGNQVLADLNNNGQSVSGMPKLSQRFVLQLMTPFGSVPQSADGSDFVARLTTRRIASEVDVFAAFASSLGQVVSRLQAEQTEDDPDDEILASVRVDQLVLAQGVVNLKISLTSQAGQTSGVELPLTFIFT